MVDTLEQHHPSRRLQKSSEAGHRNKWQAAAIIVNVPRLLRQHIRTFLSAGRPERQQRYSNEKE
jgi:hypothetical protein